MVLIRRITLIWLVGHPRVRSFSRMAGVNSLKMVAQLGCQLEWYRGTNLSPLTGREVFRFLAADLAAQAPE